MSVRGVILVVDDTPGNLKLLIDILTADGYRVLPANSGELALAAVAARAPDLILLDMRMPGLDGVEVCRRLKADPSSRDIPIMFISAFGDGAERLRAFELGAVDFVSKPFQPEELRARVRTHIDLRHAQLKLQEALAAAERFREALDHTPAYVYMKDAYSRYVYGNRATLELFGCSAAELTGKGDRDFFPPGAVERLRDVDARVLGGARTAEEIEVADSAAGRRVYWEVKTPIFAANGSDTVWGILGISTDITERKETERALQQSHDLIAKLAAQVPGTVYQYRLDPDGRSSFPFSSPGMMDMLEITPDEVRKDATPAFGRLHPEDAERVSDAILESARTLAPFHCEFRVVLPRQGLSWRLCDARPERMEDGGTLWHGIISDMTGWKEAEETLSLSLREKEGLLKEVHHRVKNNLQVITSLLRLETSRSGVSDTRRVLKDMQGRIMSMALLHETLYRSGRFGQVDLSVYLRQLAQQMFRANSTTAVRLETDLSPVQVAIDQAIPCGLILNELLTNSLKHAFVEGQGGEVRVTLRHGADDVVCLAVTDSGAGLPADFDVRRGKSLGLQLVSDLARQLGGRLEVGPGPGAGFNVFFTPTAQSLPPVEAKLNQ